MATLHRTARFRYRYPHWRRSDDVAACGARAERAQVFLTASAATAWFLIRWLALAFVMESLMTAWLPPDVIARWLGAGPFAIPTAVLVGVPVYINALAAVPFVAGLTSSA
jgi:uncharacterized membrane protein YraQ (UPF0718 family)